jgi:protein-disulfide isomerase
MAGDVRLGRRSFTGGMIVTASALLIGKPAQANAAAADTAWLDNALYHDPASPCAGNPHGTVALVKFFDYRCPYCRVMQPRIAELLKRDPAVKVIFKEWPIFGDISIYAARVALASQWQGKYLAVHKALFTIPRNTDKDAVRGAAKEAGADLVRLDDDLAHRSGEIQQTLDRTGILARRLQLEGTPAFVSDHTVVPGAVSSDDLKQFVTNGRLRE